MCACWFVKQHHLAPHGCWQEGPSHGEVRRQTLRQRATGRSQLSNIFGEFDHYLKVTERSPRTGHLSFISFISARHTVKNHIGNRLQVTLTNNYQKHVPVFETFADIKYYNLITQLGHWNSISQIISILPSSNLKPFPSDY